MAGRPTKLDDARADGIVESIEQGCGRLVAAQANGIGKTTLMQWLKRGADGESPYAEFRARVKEAEAEAEKAMVAVVKSAALGGTWQAAAWWLERRRGKTYALKRDVKLEIAPMSEEDARKKYKELTGKDYGAE